MGQLSALILAGLIFMAGQACAQNFHRCPDAFLDKPRCLDTLVYFRDPGDWQARECRRDVEAFVAQMNELQDCYQKMAREASVEAADRARLAVREFNCIMRGEQLCRGRY